MTVQDVSFLCKGACVAFTYEQETAVTKLGTKVCGLVWDIILVAPIKNTRITLAYKSLWAGDGKSTADYRFMNVYADQGHFLHISASQLDAFYREDRNRKAQQYALRG